MKPIKSNEKVKRGRCVSNLSSVHIMEAQSDHKNSQALTADKDSTKILTIYVTAFLNKKWQIFCVERQISSLRISLPQHRRSTLDS